jgi:hypothetical protein
MGEAQQLQLISTGTIITYLPAMGAFCFLQLRHLVLTKARGFGILAPGVTS